VESLNRMNGRMVAFCGTRGVPANYGGFETAVDEISQRFVKNGYDCAVFCRESSSGKMLKYHEGRRLIYVKGSSHRALDTFVSAFQTGWHLLRNRKDYGHVFWFNNANLPGILLTLLARIPTSVNTDGMEWRRAKWKWPFKAYYLLASILISLLCRGVISDSKAMQSFYKKAFGRDTEFVPYGVPRTPAASPHEEPEILDRYRVTSGRYFLQITRFEPDNLPLNAARAFKAAHLAENGFKLLLIGYKHGTSYAEEIKSLSGENGILVAGAVYDPEVLSVLRDNCFCYVHGNSVGGTNPALLEAMATCPRVLAIEGPFSREVLGDEGRFFEPNAMGEALREALSYPENSAAMRKRVRSRYQWTAVARSYINLTEGRPANYSTLRVSPELVTSRKKPRSSFRELPVDRGPNAADVERGA
jgi:glycosyltransferase involved in cell wall biosynthesis